MDRVWRAVRIRSCVGVWAWAAMCAIVLKAAPARADVTLRWMAPHECLDEAGLRAMFEAAVGTSIESSGAPGTLIEVRFEREPGQRSVRVRIEGPSEARDRVLTIDGDDCHRLDEGLVVIVALLLDEVTEEQAARESPPIRLPTSENLRENTSNPPIRGALAGGVLARVDSLPGMAGAAQLVLGLRPIDALVLELSVAGFPGVESIQADGVGARVLAGGVSLGGCGLSRMASFFELGGCISVWATGILATGIGFERRDSSTGGEIAGVLDARIGVQLVGPLWMRGGAGLGVSVVRAQIHFIDGGEVRVIHESAPVYPVMSLAFELRLGE